MPTQIPLPMPPGDGYAMNDLARDVTRAARRLAAVDERLLGPATEAPGWLGADAAAAAEQLTGVVALIQAAGDAMRPAAERLAAHGDCLLTARRHVNALRDEQRQQFADAYRRWANLPDLQMQIQIGAPAARAIVDEVEAGEASRRRRHAALLEDLEEDAAATARVLAESCAVVGGRGRSGDANRVIAYLAAQLPGWGDRELIRRGRALAERLMEGDAVMKGNELATDAVAFAGSPAFANGFLAGLGKDGVIWMLRFLGTNQFGPRPPMAQLLAEAFGGATPSGGPGDRVAEVLAAQYVSADPDNGDPDTLAAGVATVLAAGLTLRSGGVQTSTVAEWTRQILVREQALGAPVGRRQVAGAPDVSDPTALAIGVLADRADPAVSAALLGDSRVWDALLTRSWNDGGEALGRVLALAASQPGGAGAEAVRTGLEVIGTGLQEGDPTDWTVARATVAAISPALGSAVVAQLSVATEALRAPSDVTPVSGRTGVLEGLGYLVLDPQAAAAVEAALEDWVSIQAGEIGAGPVGVPTAAVTVPAAYLAVMEHGQRLAHALDADELRANAQSDKWAWDHSAGEIPNLLPYKAAVPARVLERGLALLFDADGTWDDQPDTGLVFDEADAAAATLVRLAPNEVAHADAVAGQARAAFRNTSQLLGVPKAPQSPDKDYLPLMFAGAPTGWDRLRSHAWGPDWLTGRVSSLLWSQIVQF